MEVEDQPNAAPASAPALSGETDPRDCYVLHSSVMNALAEFLLNQPFREVNHLVRMLDGTRTLDEYIPERPA